MVKILYFTSATCRPCKQFQPVAESVCEQLEIPMQVIKAEEDQVNFTRYAISSVPSIIVLVEDVAKTQIIGATTRYDLEKKIRNAMR